MTSPIVLLHREEKIVGVLATYPTDFAPVIVVEAPAVKSTLDSLDVSTASTVSTVSPPDAGAGDVTTESDVPTATPSRSNSISGESLALPRAPSLHACPRRVHGLILQSGSLGLIIPSYEAIFNDFDPRPLHEAELSHDFLRELQSRLSRLRGRGAGLQLLVPAGERDGKTEECIAERVNEHFRQKYLVLKQARRVGLCVALLWLILGTAIMFAGTLIDGTSVGWQLLATTMSPAGWFMTWWSLDKFYEVWRARTRLTKAQQLAQLKPRFAEFSVPEPDPHQTQTA